MPFDFHVDKQAACLGGTDPQIADDLVFADGGGGQLVKQGCVQFGCVTQAAFGFGLGWFGLGRGIRQGCQ